MSTTGDTGNLLDASGGNNDPFDLADILGVTEQRNQQQRQQQQNNGQTQQTNGQTQQNGDATNPHAEANRLLAKQLAAREQEIAQVLEENRRLSQQSGNQYTRVDGGGPTNQTGNLTQVPAASDQWGRVKEDYNNRFLTDPVGVVLELLQANNGNLTKEMQKMVGTVAGSTTNLELSNFRNQMANSDPDWKLAQAKFDQFTSSEPVRQQLANMPPEARTQALQMMYDATVTQSRRDAFQSRQNAEPQRREIPAYGEGTDYATTSGQPQIPNNVTFGGKALNAVQRDIMESLSPEFIKQYPARVKAMLEDAANEV